MNSRAILLQKLQNYCNRADKSQNKVAKEIGISPATLSAILNHKHELISDEMWRIVAGFFPADTGWNLVSTNNLEEIVATCQDAQQNSRMMAVAQPTGYGKTTALRYYKAESGAVNVFMVTADVLMSQRELLNDILQSMGKHCEGTNSTRMKAICNYFMELDKPLLIIDDAGKLKGNAFSIIQMLFDKCEGRIGIVLSGTEALRNDLERKMRKGRNGFPEFFRRIGYWLRLQSPDSNSIADICTANGVQDIECIKYLAKKVSNYGTLREYIRNAAIYSQEHNQPISLEMLQKLNVS